MADGSTNTELKKNLAGGRLDSWKEIAGYVNRDVATVQRWEKREGMPVHRHLHNKRGSVYAVPEELDAWREGRKSPSPDEKNSTLPSAVAPGDTAGELRRKRPIVVLALVAAALAAIGFLWLERTDRFWRNPIAGARFEAVTDWDGLEQAAAISRDGQFIAFLSDRDGHMDVWVTQVGSGQFHNLTHGSAAELVNPSVRTLGFSPDGSLVTYWVRKPDPLDHGDISIWAVPTLGGEPRPYLEGAAEYAWSGDGRQLVYHTPSPGDQLLVSGGGAARARPIFTAPAGLHSHFPFWAPDQRSIYFVHGSLPDKLDIWRIALEGGARQRITEQGAQVSYPVFLNRRTILYLATDPGGSGPWLYSEDVEHRIPHRLSTGIDRYTSLAASSDGRRLVATLATPKTSLWHLDIDDVSGTRASVPSPVPLTTGSGFRPRMSSNRLLYVSTSGASTSIWSLANGTTTELWRGQDAEIIGGPSLSADGHLVAFSTRQDGRSRLYAMKANGANPVILTDSVDLQGDPAWEPDGQALITAVLNHGTPHLIRVPLSGGPSAPFVSEPASDPAWTPDGSFVLFTGPDIGTTFYLKAAKADGSAFALPPLVLTRGSRHLAFLKGGRTIVVLRGEIQHKNLWLINLDTGAAKQLTDLPSNFNVRDFDVSPDGHEAILERIQDRSEVVLVELARH